MPFYEYQCTNCGHSLEAMQKVSDPPLKKCPHCGKPQLQKLMSAPVFRLKGGGWYETDFKSDQDQKRNLADRPEADAPKEDKKDKAETTAKEGAAEAAKPDKGADKAPAAEPAKAPAAAASTASAGSSRRGTGSGAGKAHVRPAAKRSARPARKRSAAKPARRR